MATRQEDTVVVCKAGVLSRNDEQHLALWLERFFGIVDYRDYDQKRFVIEREVDMTVTQIEEYLDQGLHVSTLGTSLGGNVAMLAHSRILAKRSDVSDRLKLVMVDSPAGYETLPQARPFPQWLVTSPVGTGVLIATGAGISFVNQYLRGTGLPKRHETMMPDDPSVRHYLAHRADLTEDQWYDWVSRTAQRNLSGHRGRVLADQNQLLASHGLLTQLDHAAGIVSGHQVAYVPCTMGNVNVTQPAAVNWYAQRIQGLRVVEVHGTHAGYLQMQQRFADAIIPLLLHAA